MPDSFVSLTRCIHTPFSRKVCLPGRLWFRRSSPSVIGFYTTTPTLHGSYLSTLYSKFIVTLSYFPLGSCTPEQPVPLLIPKIIPTLPSETSQNLFIDYTRLNMKSLLFLSDGTHDTSYIGHLSVPSSATRGDPPKSSSVTEPVYTIVYLDPTSPLNTIQSFHLGCPKRLPNLYPTLFLFVRKTGFVTLLTQKVHDSNPFDPPHIETQFLRSQTKICTM